MHWCHIARYLERPAGSSPTFGEVVALLAKEFILPYQGATLWSAYYWYKRKSGSSGKEVQRDLLNAWQAMLDDGIPEP